MSCFNVERQSMQNKGKAGDQINRKKFISYQFLQIIKRKEFPSNRRIGQHHSSFYDIKNSFIVKKTSI